MTTTDNRVRVSTEAEGDKESSHSAGNQRSTDAMEETYRAVQRRIESLPKNRWESFWYGFRNG